MRQLSFEACCSASGFRVEWKKDFSCIVLGAGLYEPLYLEGSITTPRRFADALARELDLPAYAISNPIIPDDVYVPGSWNEGSIEKDMKMWNNALATKDTIEQPELTFLTCRLGDCLSGDYVTCQAPFEGRAAKKYIPGDGETILTTEVDGVETKRLIRGKLPAYEGMWLCPLELDRTPFWEKLSNAVEFKISTRNVPKFDDVMKYFKRMSLKEDGYCASTDDEDDYDKRERSDNEGSGYDSNDSAQNESDGDRENPNDYNTDDGSPERTEDRREISDPVHRRRNWREDHGDGGAEQFRRKPLNRYSHRCNGDHGEHTGRDRREQRRHDYRKNDEKPYFRKNHSDWRDDRSDRRRPNRDYRNDNRHKKNAKIGIDVGNDYNHDLRKIFNRAMPDEAIIETLKNPEGRLIRMMQYRDKSTTKPLIMKLKNFRASGPGCRKPVPFEAVLEEIDRLARGQVGTAATLFKQLYTDFVIEADLGCINRAALRRANMSGF